jgi:hypothetical protein
MHQEWDHGNQISQSQTEKNAVATLSVVSNSLLVVLKLIIGALTGSVSVMSEAIHSGVDLIASINLRPEVLSHNCPKRKPEGLERTRSR